MRLGMIVAASENNVIGDGKKIPWNIPEDRQRFKQITTGHPVIMGWKTYESIGKPLPNRLNIILSSEKNYGNTFSSLEEALRFLEQELPLQEKIDYSQAWIIGGQRVYEEGMKIADVIELTRVKGFYEGNVSFPKIGDEWIETFRQDFDKHSFITYNRKA